MKHAGYRLVASYCSLKVGWILEKAWSQASSLMHLSDSKFHPHCLTQDGNVAHTYGNLTCFRTCVCIVVCRMEGQKEQRVARQ